MYLYKNDYFKNSDVFPQTTRAQAETIGYTHMQSETSRRGIWKNGLQRVLEDSTAKFIEEIYNVHEIKSL